MKAPPASDEVACIRARYDSRKALPADLYDPAAPYNFMTAAEKRIALARWIGWSGIGRVSARRLLEIGCGGGANLLEFISLGFQPEHLAGNELLEERATATRRILPQSVVVIPDDASEIDLPDESFDVVYQSTVFTSILDDDFQQKLADRMWRLTKPGGGVLWYDFIYNNPWNPDVRGVPIRRIRQLFPDGLFHYRRLTLAPPIGRLVTRLSPNLYSVFNVLPFLRTHVLCWIRKPS